MQQVADALCADTVPHLPQLRGQFAQAFARPAQRRLGVAAGDGFHQRFQVGKQSRVALGEWFASGSRASNTALSRQGARVGLGLRQLLEAGAYRVLR